MGHKVIPFKPIDKIVRIYSCGPTVYNNVHIGNLSSFIYTDTLRRSIKIAGYEVKHVMNITDVDDKTISISKIKYPEESPLIALNTLTRNYENEFKESLVAVGVQLEELEFIKATDSIQIIQDLITQLLNNGFAYIATDGIYFSIQAYQDDGKKYGQLLDLNTENKSKQRIKNDEYDKNSIHDFVLWKFMRPNEPTWSFVINDIDYLGRPGWHIECSAMSVFKLDQPFDIHTGGVDLIFPHHENEIAQSTAGKKNSIYANFFVHNEHLLVNKKKMSKSLGNVYNLNDILDRGFNPLAYRLMILQGHYRNQANFSWELLEAAESRLNDLRRFVSLIYQLKNKTNRTHDFNGVGLRLKEAYLDDLNTPKVLAILSDFQNSVQSELVGVSQKNEFANFIELLDILLGLDLSSVKDIDDLQKSLLNKREDARQQKNWEKSDQFRQQLSKLGLGVRDTPLGPIWFYC